MLFLPLALLEVFLNVEAPACGAAPQLRARPSGAQGRGFCRCLRLTERNAASLNLPLRLVGLTPAGSQGLRSCCCSAPPPGQQLLRHLPGASADPAKIRPVARSRLQRALLRIIAAAGQPLPGVPPNHSGASSKATESSKCKEIGSVQSMNTEGSAQAELENELVYTVQGAGTPQCELDP